MKAYLLKGLSWLYELPPSQWNVAIILKFKSVFLPKLIKFVNDAPDQNFVETKVETKKDIVDVAKEIFDVK